jgi:hydroxyacylglutathione hydrolase
MPASTDTETLRLRLQATDPPLLLAAASLADYERARIPGACRLGDMATLLRAVPRDRAIIVAHNATDDLTVAWASRLLAEHGYRDVTIHVGGLRSWEAAGLPIDHIHREAN